MTVEEAEKILDDMIPNWRTYDANELDFQAANIRATKEAHPDPRMRSELHTVISAFNTIILSKKEQDV